MIRLIAVAGFLAFATSAQAMMPAPIPQPDGMITQVRLGCAHLGPELMVSAWPEPPSGRPAEPSAGASAGAIERKRPTNLASDCDRSDASGRCSQHAVGTR